MRQSADAQHPRFTGSSHVDTHDADGLRVFPLSAHGTRFGRQLGKKVDFVTHGAATELDKGLIERIVDPLTHLVCNSVDHGFEMPDVRVANGKNEAGKLSLQLRIRAAIL